MLKHKTTTMKLSELKPAPYNPRKITEKALKGLTKSLLEFGLVQPIIFNKRTGVVVGGHQRIKALQAAGETEAPVIVVDLDEKREKALNIALNNPKIEGDFTPDLRPLLDSIAKELPELYKGLNMQGLESLVNVRGAKGEKPEVQFTEELMESHNYVVLWFDNEIDWLQLQTLYPLKTVKALDSREGYLKAGIGRVVKGQDFLNAILRSK